jgi:hypothetical protein
MIYQTVIPIITLAKETTRSNRDVLTRLLGGQGDFFLITVVVTAIVLLLPET